MNIVLISDGEDDALRMSLRSLIAGKWPNVCLSEQRFDGVVGDLTAQDTLLVHLPSPQSASYRQCRQAMLDMATRAYPASAIFLSYSPPGRYEEGIGDIVELDADTNFLRIPFRVDDLYGKIEQRYTIPYRMDRVFAHVMALEHVYAGGIETVAPRKKEYTFLLADDELGFEGLGKYMEKEIEKRLQGIPNYRDVSVTIRTESDVDRVARRAKTEPIDLLILDLEFGDKAPGYARKQLREEIRPFDPALPVVILTGTSQNDIQWASEYAGPPYRTGYFEKRSHKGLFREDERGWGTTDASWEAFIVVLFKQIVEREGLRDKIEIDEHRNESTLEAYSRDYMQTETLYRLKHALENDLKPFSLVFLDLDGMKALNEASGSYYSTNEVIVRLSRWIDGFVRKGSEACVLGRFFRERGDEFLLLLPYGKGEAHSLLEELREELRRRPTQTELLGDIEEEHPELEISCSFGLFTFPDDLPEILKTRVRTWSGMDLDARAHLIDDLFGEITGRPQRLEQAAKSLGKDQICSYLPGCRRLRVGVLHQEGQEGEAKRIRSLFESLFGDMVFQYEVLAIGELAEAERMATRFRVLVMLVHNVDEVQDVLRNWIIDRRDTAVILLAGDPEELRSRLKGMSVGASIEFCNHHVSPSAILEFEEPLAGAAPEVWDEIIISRDALRELRYNLFHLLGETSPIEQRSRFYPRFEVQRALHREFEGIKSELVLGNPQEGTGARNEDDQRIAEVNNGLQIAPPETIWVAERQSNKKGVQGKKYALVLTLKVTTPEAYTFLYQESSRNFVKLQNFYDGFLKGFMNVNVDKRYADHLIDFEYKVDDARRGRERRASWLVCRSPELPPVDDRSYAVRIAPNRVRIDVQIDPNVTRFESLGAEAVQHISFDFAQDIGLVDRDSVIGRFITRYDDLLSGDRPFDLVSYVGSELIGPSVQVAELAGCVAASLADVKVQRDSLFRMCDIFSGSGATCIPTLSHMLEPVKEGKLRVEFYCVDDHPSDFVQRRFSAQEGIGAVPVNVDVFAMMKEGKTDEIFGSHEHFDLIVADPPHVFTLDFLIAKMGDRRMVDVIAERADVFIIYYAHREQEELCRFTREKLGEAFPYVFRCIVGGEEMAVCSSYLHKTSVERAVEEASAVLDREYGISMKAMLDAVPSEELGRVFVLSGPSGIGKSTYIRRLAKDFGGQLLSAVSATTRPPRADEVDGREYYFMSYKEFNYRNMREEFIETDGNYASGIYGTLKVHVDDVIRQGRSVMLDINVKGLRELKAYLQNLGARCFGVFICPPKGREKEFLAERLSKRDSETGSDRRIRIEAALSEVEQARSMPKGYDLFVTDEGRGEEEVYAEIRAFVQERI